jgi:hypothetical protein
MKLIEVSPNVYVNPEAIAYIKLHGFGSVVGIVGGEEIEVDVNFTRQIQGFVDESMGRTN